MLIDAKIIKKLETIEKVYQDLRFAVIESLPAEIATTQEYFRRAPAETELCWRPVKQGDGWGEDWQTAWFRASVTIPETLDGQPVFLRAKTGAPESLLLVDGMHRGVFDVNHPVRLLALRAEKGRTHQIHLEAYAGHSYPGTQPYPEHVTWSSPVKITPGCRNYQCIELVSERNDVSAFVLRLRALRQLAANLDENSLRRAQIHKTLETVFSLVFAKPEEVGEQDWRTALVRASDVMAEALARTNGPSTPSFGIIGHSHIDTAWLWPISETWRKCARTFSSILALMDQYPEFKFVQSAAYHADAMQKMYPDIFRQIQQRVREGRWEINGAMWIEPDCNIPNGESLVRQCLIGQAATREMFGVTSDTLWLPDVFGYSAALPQILKGCDVHYFCTTKLGWNDTNRFPYDTFVWKGSDGTPILSHFNLIHCWPDPETMIKSWNWVQHKDVQDRRLLAFGFGDGGGGPQAEMIEMARITQNTDGCPRNAYTTVSSFMQSCERELTDLPTWSGELYLEMHRGTLTSIADIKRGNRKCEFALREAEFLSTVAALKGAPYPATALQDQWKVLLLNQFHDILPGSSIARVNDEAKAAFAACLIETNSIARQAAHAMAGDKGTASILISNSLSWDRIDDITLSGLPAGTAPGGKEVIAQRIETVNGEEAVVVSGLCLPALGVGAFELESIPEDKPSAFEVLPDRIVTPFAKIEIDDYGAIRSFIDLKANRELVSNGGRLNQFLIGEDVPESWDNWDIDRDQRLKLKPVRTCVSRRVTCDGPLQLRVRTEYALSENSILRQDMVLHANTERIDFDTIVDWHHKFRFLKSSFDLNLLADIARHEVQFGHVCRHAHDNTMQDRAQFDVCAHKWTNISETGYGVAFLNDCKYACTVKDGNYRISLIKSGRHPDPRGDEGTHRFTYSLLPHDGGFSVESVVRPAYEMNIRPTAALIAAKPFSPFQLATLDSSNVIVESVKWAENGDGFVLRLYEASRTGTHVRVRFGAGVREVLETNLLEEKGCALEISNQSVSLYFRPFEIKTLVCR